MDIDTFQVGPCLHVSLFRMAIRHINPLMFDVIDDEPEGEARGVYHV